jgi:DNA-binding GntR family transcriptional regulator
MAAYEISWHLHYQLHNHMIRIARLRSTNNVPYVIEHIYHHLRLFPDLPNAVLAHRTILLLHAKALSSMVPSIPRHLRNSHFRYGKNYVAKH